VDKRTLRTRVSAADERRRSPIDFIDSEQLLDMLKASELGLKTEIVEAVTINKDWFRGL